MDMSILYNYLKRVSHRKLHVHYGNLTYTFNNSNSQLPDRNRNARDSRHFFINPILGGCIYRRLPRTFYAYQHLAVIIVASVGDGWFVATERPGSIQAIRLSSAKLQQSSSRGLIIGSGGYLCFDPRNGTVLNLLDALN